MSGDYLPLFLEMILNIECWKYVGMTYPGKEVDVCRTPSGFGDWPELFNPPNWNHM